MIELLPLPAMMKGGWTLFYGSLDLCIFAEPSGRQRLWLGDQEAFYAPIVLSA